MLNATYTNSHHFGLTNVATSPFPSSQSSNSIWLNFNTGTTANIPFILYGIHNSYYNVSFYSGATSATITTNTYTNLTTSLPALPETSYFNILPLNSSSVVVNSSTGQMTSNTEGTFTFYIFGGVQYLTGTSASSPLYYGYNTISFTLNVVHQTPQNYDILFKMYNAPSRKNTAKQIKVRLGKLFR